MGGGHRNAAAQRSARRGGPDWAGRGLRRRGSLGVGAWRRRFLETAEEEASRGTVVINLRHASPPRGLPSQAFGLGSGSGSGPGRRSSTAASDDPSLKRALTVGVCCCAPSLCDGSRLQPEQPCVCSGPVLVGYKQCISCGSKKK